MSHHTHSTRLASIPSRRWLVAISACLITAVIAGPANLADPVLAAGAAASADQCANGQDGSVYCDDTGGNTGWVTGNVNGSKALYYEGDSVPYRATFTGLDESDSNGDPVTYSITLLYDVTKSTKHAIDYLTSFDETIATPQTNPCFDQGFIAGCQDDWDDDEPIPEDTTMTSQEDWMGTWIEGEFRLWGGAITDVSDYDYTDQLDVDGEYIDTASAKITVSFTVDGTTNITCDSGGVNCNVVLSWAGHIATGTDWGIGNSAASITGSPYHTALDDFACDPDIGCSTGQGDLSLAAGAVLYPAEVTIVKDASPDTSDAFGFTTSPDIGSFSLTDNGTSSESETFVFDGIANPDFGTYTFTEGTPTAPYKLKNIECTVHNVSGTADATVDIPNSDVDVTVGEGDRITCTFTNQPEIDLQVVTTCYDYAGSSPYTIANDTVTHAGGSANGATSTTIEHELDAGATYDDFLVVSAPLGSTTLCSAAPASGGGEIVTCTLSGTLGTSDTWSVDIIVDYPGGPDGSVSNTATVSAAEADTVSTNDQDSCGSTVPVTLSYFEAQSSGDSLQIDWSTATEAGNVGFNIYAATDDGWLKLNEQLIPSHAVDSLDRQDYAFEVDGFEADSFRIEDVDVFAETRAHGEFALGEAYGARVDSEPIDWPAIGTETALKADSRRKSRLSAAAPGFGLAGLSIPESTYVTSEGALGASLYGVGSDINSTDEPHFPTCDLLVDVDGTYRVTYEHLRSTCADLRGVALGHIAVVNHGQPVPITVVGRRTFGPGSYVEFNGEAVDTLYTHTNVYTLVVDPSLAQRIPVEYTLPLSGVAPEPYYFETVTVENENNYSFSAPAGDPWFDTQMLAIGGPRTWTFGFDVSDLVTAAQAGLDVSMWGGSDFPDEPDHHVLVDLNGLRLADDWFDGLAENSVSIPLPSEMLSGGHNTLEITLPVDAGLPWDLVNLEGFSVTYPRAFFAPSGSLTFESDGLLFDVHGLPSTDVVVYRLGDGSPVKIGWVTVSGGPGGFIASFPGTGQPATYVVTTADSLPAPAVEPALQDEDITTRPAQFLVISHPDFMADLTPLVQARTAQGYVVEVVDVDQVYSQFGYGVLDPQAIKDYIAYAAAYKGAEYVMLVGGDTYDYLDHLGQGAVGFLPSLYTRTDAIVAFSPVDPLYTDLDGDMQPDLPIGRLPARSSAELITLVDKILAYDVKSYDRTAVFAADSGDGKSSFSAMSNMLIDQLPEAWNVDRAYVDELGVAAAKQRIVDTVNSGTALTSFFGHSSLDRWTFRGLFSSSDAASLANFGKPTVVTQWGCWNTYYVSPNYNTLAHKFMLEGDRGAAAVLGASTLTRSSSERALGVLTMPLLTQPGMPIGLAVQRAKDQLAVDQPDALDVLLGWTLLGDPTMVVHR